MSRADWIELMPGGRSRKFELMAGDYIWVHAERAVDVTQAAAATLPIKLILGLQKC